MRNDKKLSLESAGNPNKPDSAGIKQRSFGFSFRDNYLTTANKHIIRLHQMTVSACGRNPNSCSCSEECHVSFSA